MDITHDNVCSSMLSCFYSHLLSTGRPISSCLLVVISLADFFLMLLVSFFSVVNDLCACEYSNIYSYFQ